MLVYGPLKDNLGFSRIRVAYTAGEAIGPEIFAFYRSLGVNIKQIYGMTEATALVCGQRDGEVDPEAVGDAHAGGRAAHRRRRRGPVPRSGELPGLLTATTRRPAEMRGADGWISSGDAGYFDGGGQLRIIDRARDVGKLADGTLFAPKYLENKLKFSQYILEAVAHGGGREFVCAFVNIDLEAVGNWAERRGLAYTSYTDLAGKAEVYDLVAREIASVNAGAGGGRGDGRGADPPLPHPAQAAGPGRQRAHPDAQGPPAVRRREIRRTLIDALFGGARGSARVEARVDVRGRARGRRRGDARKSATWSRPRRSRAAG